MQVAEIKPQLKRLASMLALKCSTCGYKTVKACVCPDCNTNIRRAISDEDLEYIKDLLNKNPRLYDLLERTEEIFNDPAHDKLYKATKESLSEPGISPWDEWWDTETDSNAMMDLLAGSLDIDSATAEDLLTIFYAISDIHEPKQEKKDKKKKDKKKKDKKKDKEKAAEDIRTQIEGTKLKTKEPSKKVEDILAEEEYKGEQRRKFEKEELEAQEKDLNEDILLDYTDIIRDVHDDLNLEDDIELSDFIDELEAENPRNGFELEEFITSYLADKVDKSVIDDIITRVTQQMAEKTISAVELESGSTEELLDLIAKEQPAPDEDDEPDDLSSLYSGFDKYDKDDEDDEDDEDYSRKRRATYNSRRILAMAQDIENYHVFDKNLGQITHDENVRKALKKWTGKLTFAGIKARLQNCLEHGNIATGIPWIKVRALIHEHNRRANKFNRPLIDETAICKQIFAMQKDDLAYTNKDAYSTKEDREAQVLRQLEHTESGAENTDLFEPNSRGYDEQFVKDYPQGDGKGIDYNSPIDPGAAALLIWRKLSFTSDTGGFKPEDAVAQFLSTQDYYSDAQKKSLQQHLHKLGFDVDVMSIKTKPRTN